jgi:small subunit ribosomal protein S7
MITSYKQSATTKLLFNTNPLFYNKKNFSDTELLFKFANLLMRHGKKHKTYAILYQALHLLYIKNSRLNFMNMNKKSKYLLNLHTKNTREFLFIKLIFLQAIENVQPNVEVRNVKISGRKYQVPYIIHRKRQQFLAMRWIIDCAKKRKKASNMFFSECLSLELFDALKKFGKVKQKRDMIHQQAESNRAYIRFKWW